MVKPEKRLERLKKYSDGAKNDRQNSGAESKHHKKMESKYFKNKGISIKEQEIIDEEEMLCDWINPCMFIGKGIKFLKKTI